MTPTTVHRPPNVVFVLTDDQGYGDLGCHGNPVIETPNIDAFHDESIRFTNFHVGPTCAPTRAGLLTGHYSNSTGVWHTIGGRSLLRRNEWTLASALREAGYRTGIFGKWHLGDTYPYRPQDRGFDETVIHGGGGISQTPDYWGNDYFDDTYRVNGEPVRFSGYCTDVWFDQALQFIERNKDVPFFCYIATNAPHTPYNVEQRYYEMYRGKVPDARARFYGMITCIDDNFGVLRRGLMELGLEDNTILVFMTDNGTSGGATRDKAGFIVDGYNAGLRGIKGSPYDGGHRVPFFLRWPAGGFDTAADIDRITAHVDFMPTILDLCGVEVGAEHSFHGQSLKPLMCGQEQGWPDRIIVTDSQRVARPIKWRRSAVMTDRWRLINGKELYDMTVDRGQHNDVSSDHQDVVQELRKAYEEWWGLVSTQFDEEIPISIARDRETILTCHDWRNEDCQCPWNQGHIRSGMLANGYWEVEIEDDGQYVIELRRWPREFDLPMTADTQGNDIEWRMECIAESDWAMYTGGTALPLSRARLRIGEVEVETEVGDGDRCVRFELDLSKGPAHLQTWMIGPECELGAYYVYIRPA